MLHCTGHGPVSLLVLPTAPGLKSSVILYFWMPMHLIVTLPSSTPLRQFMWHFCCFLSTLYHRCILFCNPCNLCALSKVNYITFSFKKKFFFLTLTHFYYFWCTQICPHLDCTMADYQNNLTFFMYVLVANLGVSD